MVRLCERPGCSQPADLSYGIDAAHLTVWIEPLDPARPDRPGVLCRRHADSMVVPLRWTLDDRREPVPRLFRLHATSEPAPRQRATSRPIHPAPPGTQLELDDDGLRPTAADLVPSPSPHVDGTDGTGGPVADVASAADATGSPWRPVFDPDDDLDGLLDASGPLLSRAFRGRERSAPVR